MEIKVDKSTCTGCSLCKGACLYDAIEIKDGVAVIGETCVFCGACVESCKFESIEIIGLDTEEKDFSDYKGVWVYLEAHGNELADVGLELLSEGRKLADKLKAPLAGIAIGSCIDKISSILFSKIGSSIRYSLSIPY